MIGNERVVMTPGERHLAPAQGAARILTLLAAVAPSAGPFDVLS